MSWLLDSNIFIQAANDYYHFGICPGFWDWLLQHTSEVRSVEKVQEEILAKEDDLATWCKDKLPDGFFITPDEGIYQRLREITDYVKALPSPYDLKKKNKFLSSADTMLLATAMQTGDVIVTHEKDDPRSHNKIYLPQIANYFHVQHTRLFDVMHQLDARFIQDNSSFIAALNENPKASS